jgi:hypothetical protein
VWASAVFGPRDVVWGLLLGVGGMLLVQSLPLWRAEQHVEEQALHAFLEAYTGAQMIDGTIIKPRGAAGARIDTATPHIHFRTIRKVAERVSWNGARVELVYRHVIGFDRARPELNLTHEVYVRLKRVDDQLRYMHFQVRGEPPMPLPIADNPWLALLVRSKAAVVAP